MSSKAISAIAAILIILITIIYFVFHFKQNRMISISALELSSSFISDETEANERFVGETIKVTGEVKEIISKAPFTIVLSGDQTDIQCIFKETADIQKGMSITISGRCTGFLIEVVLDNCELIKS